MDRQGGEQAQQGQGALQALRGRQRGVFRTGKRRTGLPACSAKTAREVFPEHRRGEELVGEVQSVGTGAKREVYLPRLRFLLGAVAAQPALRDGEAANQPEEIPQRPQGDEGMDPQGSLSETERVAGGIASQAAGLSELLRRHWEFDDAGEVLLRSGPTALQVAQPPQPASVNDLGAVHASSARLGASAAQGGGAASHCRIAPSPKTCMMESENKPRTSVASNARSPRSPVR